MNRKKPNIHWRRGHRYVYVQVEITEQQWLDELDQDIRIGRGGHIRFAISQYRARVKQQHIELTKRLLKEASGKLRRAATQEGCHER
jgi:hypothetical protein